METRDKLLVIRITPAQDRLLAERADAIGLNKSSLVRLLMADFLQGAGGLPRRVAQEAA